jgi:hypothetical protein
VRDVPRHIPAARLFFSMGLGRIEFQPMPREEGYEAV